MMPFTVFRSFLLLLLSWAILGAGIYFAYDLLQELRRENFEKGSSPRVVRVPAESADVSEAQRLDSVDSSPEGDRISPADTQIVIAPRQESNWSQWGKLAIVIACLGLSVGGRLPVKWIFDNGPPAKAGAFSTAKLTATSSFEVNRPDGTRLRGEIFGGEHKPTLLLTHGWSLDSSAWKYVSHPLADQFRVVVWDLPGLGHSQGPRNNDYSLEKLANDLNAVLEHVAADGPVILVGHSIGGMTEQTFCRLHKDKLGTVVKGIVLLHTTYTDPVSTNMLAGITKPLEPLIGMMNFLMIPLAPLMWLSNWQSYFNGTAHVAARIESFTGKQTWQQLDHSAQLGARAWPGVLARGNFGMMKFNEERTLPEVSVPVLVVSGTHDRLTVKSASEHISNLLPNDVPLSDEGGHLGYWEYNEQVCAAIQQFASGLVHSIPANERSSFA